MTLSALEVPVGSISIDLVNHCSSQTIWPAVTGTMIPNGEAIDDPLPPGFALRPLARYTIDAVSLPWTGRIWARQYCSPRGTECKVGDCGSSTCLGRSSSNVTLFEMTALMDVVWYNLSLGRSP
jgi:hypothetical protein